MKTSIAALLLGALLLAPLTGSFTATVADIGAPLSLDDSIRPISDETARGITGALSKRWKCAITAFSLGVGLMTIAPAFGGVPAIGAPVAFNAAAFCLV